MCQRLRELHFAEDICSTTGYESHGMLTNSAAQIAKLLAPLELEMRRRQEGVTSVVFRRARMTSRGTEAMLGLGPGRTDSDKVFGLLPRTGAAVVPLNSTRRES